MAAVGVLQALCRGSVLRNTVNVTARWSCIGALQSNRHLSSSNTFWASRKFSEKHEWVDVSGDVGTIGITDYAQDSLGDIVYAQLPEPGSEFALGEECGALESVKAASELYIPVSGKVTEVNKEVEDQPSLVNSSCYDKGWLFKVELSKPAELDGLMDEEKYQKFVKSLADS